MEMLPARDSEDYGGYNTVGVEFGPAGLDDATSEDRTDGAGTVGKLGAEVLVVGAEIFLEEIGVVQVSTPMAEDATA